MKAYSFLQRLAILYLVRKGWTVLPLNATDPNCTQGGHCWLHAHHPLTRTAPEKGMSDAPYTTYVITCAFGEIEAQLTNRDAWHAFMASLANSFGCLKVKEFFPGEDASLEYLVEPMTVRPLPSQAAFTAPQPTTSTTS